jgi:pyruvate,orthophosphate dikinase
VLVDRIEAHHTALLHDRDCTGVLAVRGSPADHFAILARESGLGYLALPGAMIDGGLRVGEAFVGFGSPLTVDFTDGRVYVGEGILVDEIDDPPRTAARRLLAARTSSVPLRVSVDSVDALGKRLRADAAGIGLLRTEHLVRLHGLSDDLRRVLDEDDSQQRSASLEALATGLERLLARVLGAADGRPVSVRLLDYPLHELGGRHAGEVNPMLGLRGVRQGVCWPELYAVQIRALLRAALAARAAGVPVHVLEILVPMVSTAAEVRLVREWVDREAWAMPTACDLPVRLGAMLETPAALADVEAIAAACDLASFGTNDLTQLVLGLSREDCVPLVQRHRERDLLPADPFDQLHPVVLRLVSEAAGRARQARPELTLGLCGNHATDPQALDLARAGLLDHLSVPIDRLEQVKLQALQP